MTQGLQPPTAPGSERAVLASVLVSRDHLDDVSEILRPEHFSTPEHRSIYAAALAVADSSDPYDLVAIGSRLRLTTQHQETLPLLASLVNDEALSNHLHHARIVATKARHREALAALQRLVAEGYGAADTNAWLERVEQVVFDLAVPSEGSDRAVTAQEAMSEALEVVSERAKPDGKRDYLPTSIEAINAKIQGLDIGYVHVVAARPGVGKTSYVVREVFTGVGKMHNGEVVGGVFFSMEMPRERLAERALTQQSLVSSKAMREGRLVGRDWEELAAGAAVLAQRQLIIDDTPSLTVQQIRSRLRRYQGKLRRKHGDSVRLRLVGVDYMQLMKAESASREEEIAAVSMGLRQIAKEFDVALIAVASLNREQARGGSTGRQRRPQLSDLRGSGQIEFDAATIMFLYNPTSDLPPSERSAETTAIFAKVRQGDPTDVRLTFDGDHQLYFEANEHQARAYDLDFGPTYDDFQGAP